MLSLATLAFLLSLFGTLWVRRLFFRVGHGYASDAPQRFHLGHVPRLGGLGLVLGWAAALAALLATWSP